MATNVTFASPTATIYAVPATGEENWGGSTKVDGLLVALATHSLQKTGGTFTLSADVDWGGSFGHKVTYVKSRATSIATTGIFRLGNAETIGWRNAANGANHTITLSASDLFAFSAGLSVTGGVTVSDNVLCGTNVATTANAKFYTTRTGYTTGTCGVYFNNSAGSDSASFGIQGSSANPTATWIAANNTFIYAPGTFKIGSGASTEIASFASSGVSLRGTNTNDSATSGFMGEYTSKATSSFTNMPATTVWGDATFSDASTSLSLTAGDWDVFAQVAFTVGTATSLANMTGGIGTTSGNSSPGTEGTEWLKTYTPSSGNNTNLTVRRRISISSTTSVYLKLFCTYSGGNPQYQGSIQARRIR